MPKKAKSVTQPAVPAEDPREEYARNVAILRTLLNTRLDFQGMRINMMNRVGLKAGAIHLEEKAIKDGVYSANELIKQDLGKDDPKSFVDMTPDKTMKVDLERFLEEDRSRFINLAANAYYQEKSCEFEMEKILKRFPFYRAYLAGKEDGKCLPETKGIGTVLSAAILAYIDIYKATTVGKLVQYCGMNPGLVMGKKTSVVKNEEGKIIEHSIDNTGVMIRGDKMHTGYNSPYNKNLKTIMLGLAADQFVRNGGIYSKIYYDMHVPKEQREGTSKSQKEELKGKFGRYDHSEKMTFETIKGGKQVRLMWKDTTEYHRDRAAKRFMMRQFLKNLYAAWRTFEGLEVRVPYEEEYLGKVHHKEDIPPAVEAKPVADKPKRKAEPKPKHSTVTIPDVATLKRKYDKAPEEVKKRKSKSS